MRSSLIALMVLGCGVLSVRADVTRLTVTGPFGERLDRLIRNHVTATDAAYLANVFHEHTTEPWWQTEFWGKYMHSAVPFWRYSGSAELKAKIDAGLGKLLAAQEPCGYLGNYSEDKRCNRGWDVWGMKYTMLGLLHYYDGVRDKGRGTRDEGRGMRDEGRGTSGVTRRWRRAGGSATT